VQILQAGLRCNVQIIFFTYAFKPLFVSYLSGTYALQILNRLAKNLEWAVTYEQK